MSFSLVYLTERAFYRIKEFLEHWYINGSFHIARNFLGFLNRIDRVLALKITLRHFFEPLYGDYSLVGRTLGLIFRTFRVFAAFLIYLLIGFLVLGIYLAWVAFPLLLLFKIINGR